MLSPFPPKAIFAVLVNIFLATTALATSVCQLPACICSDEMVLPLVVNNSNSTFGYSATCFIKSFNVWDETIAKLTPDITSLKAVCTDPHAQSHLTFGFFRQLPDLGYLGLEGCNFVTATSDAFKDLSNLTALEIDKCRFSDLPDNLFDEAPPLTRLTLTECGLERLPSLCYLTRLEKLNVSGQSLTSVDECVNGCNSDVVFQNLISLDISSNNFTQLPKKLTEKAPNLTDLYVCDNQLQTLRFENRTRLETLNALGQKLRSIDFMATDFVFHLKVLKLEGNGEVQFPTEKLVGLSNMTHLHLENMGVDDSMWEVFPFLTNLQRLVLPSNRLKSLNLTGDVHLTHLNLSRNAIGGVDSNTFAAQPGLVEIDLSGNNITKVMKGVFVDMPSLETLLLKHNQIRIVLQSGFKNLSNLQILGLAFNKISSLPVYFLKRLLALKFFSVDNNSISFLPLLTDSPQLVLLSANHNNIVSLSALRFTGLQNLEYLFLRGNRLTQVDSSIFLSAAPSLAVLDLTDNEILIVQPFGNHPGLRLIQLENNNIQDVSLVFRELPQLTGVFLDSNYLTRLTVNMFPPSLSYLSVSRNYLTFIEPSLFVNMPRLIAVNLAANYRLHTLLLSWVQIQPTMVPKPSVLVGPNVFQCDCEMGYLKTWALAQTRTSSSVDDTSSSLLANLPTFLQLSILECVTYFSNGDVVLFNDVPLEDFVCPYQQPVCDKSCPCCTQHSLDVTYFEPNCTCVLTCPDNCTCFYGGSQYVRSFARVFCDSRNLTDFPDLVPSAATHVRLDGNRLTVLNNTKPKLVTGVMFLYLNHSEIEVLEDGCFQGLDFLVLLDLSNNRLTHMKNATFGEMTALKELSLDHNHIEYIDPEAFSQLRALERLYLNDNYLKQITTFAHFVPKVSLTLSNNLWTCECAFADTFLKFLISQRDLILDYSFIRCLWYDEDSKNNSSFRISRDVKRDSESKFLQILQKSHNSTDANFTQTVKAHEIDLNGQSVPSLLMSEYQHNVLCRDDNDNLFPNYEHVRDSSPRVTTVAISCVVVMAVVVVAMGLVVVKNRREIQALLYAKLGMRLWDNAARLDREEEEQEIKGNTALQAAAAGPLAQSRPRKYDAFISFSHQDLDFVVNTLVPKLEQEGPRHYKLCVHYRDFPVGDSIADSILDSVETSKRVILLLSNHFVDSEWCLFEFRAAHQHVLREGGHRLIIVLLEGVDEDRLEPDLQMALKTRTYLSVKDPWFWEKLYFALPNVPRHHHDDNPPLRHEPEHPGADRLEDPLEDAEIRANNSEVRVNQMLEKLELEIVEEETNSLISGRESLKNERSWSDDDGDENGFTQPGGVCGPTKYVERHERRGKADDQLNNAVSVKGGDSVEYLTEAESVKGGDLGEHLSDAESVKGGDLGEHLTDAESVKGGDLGEHLTDAESVKGGDLGEHLTEAESVKGGDSVEHLTDAESVKGGDLGEHLTDAESVKGGDLGEHLTEAESVKGGDSVEHLTDAESVIGGGSVEHLDDAVSVKGGDSVGHLTNTECVKGGDSVEHLTEAESVICGDSVEHLDDAESVKGGDSVEHLDDAESVKGGDSVEHLDDAESVKGGDSVEHLDDAESVKGGDSVEHLDDAESMKGGDSVEHLTEAESTV